MSYVIMSYTNNKGADQPAHPRSLIRAFVVRCLDSVISLDSIAKISRLLLDSVAVQAGLCLAWSETPKDMFYRVMVQLKKVEMGELIRIVCPETQWCSDS